MGDAPNRLDKLRCTKTAVTCDQTVVPYPTNAKGMLQPNWRINFTTDTQAISVCKEIETFDG